MGSLHKNTKLMLDFIKAPFLVWDWKFLVDFSVGKAELVLFDQSYNTGAIDVKMDLSVLK